MTKIHLSEPNLGYDNGEPQDNPIGEVHGKTLQHFTRNIKPGARVLEIGTLRWGVNPTHHRVWVKDYSEYIMTDIGAGQDVDIVSDAHSLSETFEPESFDIVIACSVWEHLHSPWIASQQVLKILKPGGQFYIQTHLCFPEHGYPSDYFRFTKEGLKHLFKGATQMVAGYEFKCKIVPPENVVWHNGTAPEYLNVCISGIK